MTFTHGKILNIYIVCEINLWDCGYDDYPNLENCLFGVVKLVKSANIDKYKYSGYSFPTGGFYKNVTIFGVDRVLLHMLTTKKDMLILSDGPTHKD